MTENYRPTKAVIDLGAIEKNLAAFKERSQGAELIAVVKADAYGHGAVEVARRAVECGVDFLAVATPDEALYLRNQGFQTEILVLGATPAFLFGKRRNCGSRYFTGMAPNGSSFCGS